MSLKSAWHHFGFHVGQVACVRRVRQFLASCMLALALASCSSFEVDQWPESIPPRAVFISNYNADEKNQQLQPRNEYLYWVANFYTGSLIYPTGWLDIEQTILASVDSPRVAESLRPELFDIGARIGGEWAKHNDARVIDNRMLALWGSVLQLSEDDAQLSESIDAIDQDIDELLNRSLPGTDIVEARYGATADFGDFGDF